MKRTSKYHPILFTFKVLPIKDTTPTKPLYDIETMNREMERRISQLKKELDIQTILHTLKKKIEIEDVEDLLRKSPKAPNSDMLISKLVNDHLQLAVKFIKYYP